MKVLLVIVENDATEIKFDVDLVPIAFCKEKKTSLYAAENRDVVNSRRKFQGPEDTSSIRVLCQSDDAIASG